MPKYFKIGVFVLFFALLFAYGVYTRFDEMSKDGYVLKREYKLSQTEDVAEKIKLEYEIASYYEKKGDYKSAIKHYKILLEKYPYPHPEIGYLQDEAKYRIRAIEEYYLSKKSDKK